MKEQDRIEESTFDPKETIIILRRWAWLLVLGLLLSAAFSLLISTRLHPVYQATTKVLVTRTGQSQSSDFTGYLSDLQLAQTYLQLLTTKSVLDITSARTEVQIEPEDIKAEVIRDTQIIVLEVENSDPQQAALIANTMVEVLIEQNDLIQSGRYDAMEESLRRQKTQIEAEIQNIERQIQQTSTQSLEEQKVWLEGQISSLQGEEISLQQEIVEMGIVISPEERLVVDQKNVRLEQVRSLLTLYRENYNKLLLIYGNPVQTSIDTTNSQLTLLTTTRVLYQQFYATVLKDLESVHLARQQNTPNVVQIEMASAPEKPFRPRLLLNTILGGLLGFVLITGIVFLRETLNGTLKTPKAIEQVLGLPVIGFVAEMPSKDRSAEEIYVLQQLHSPVSEAFRSLRANLEFACTQKPIHTLLVTSPGPAEGKSTVAVNLAAILALSGKRVALLDADMRRPQLHRLLGVPNGDGLSDLFHSQAAVSSVCQIRQGLPQLTVITSGSLPPNPAELLGSEKMSEILTELSGQVDLVVIDTPSSLVADAQTLAGKVDAVLFVVWPGRTTSERAKASLEMFERVGARVIGTVLNRIPQNRNYYFGGYEDYYSPYSQRKGYDTVNAAAPEKIVGHASETAKTRIPFINLFVHRVARLFQVSKELPPPDPRRN